MVYILLSIFRCMRKAWKQIDSSELVRIETLLQEWYSIPRIALKLWRSKNTLYELLKTNGISYGKRRQGMWRSGVKTTRWKGKQVIHLSPQAISNKRAKRKSRASMKYHRIESWGELENYILEKIAKEQWSPEQIAGRWELDTGEILSKDTVYQYIYINYPHLVKGNFRRKGKQYQHSRATKYQLQDRRMIDERPKVVNKRKRIGDWEWDTIVGTRWGSKQVIHTNVERKSWYLLAKKLMNATGENILQSTMTLFATIPKDKAQTITYDNGREFSQHRMIEYFTKLTVYFAHPYHSWERGTNENTNWLLRQYMPKKTDFSNVSDEQLQIYQNRLNSRPRKRLKYLTPFEVFHWLKSPNSV